MKGLSLTLDEIKTAKSLLERIDEFVGDGYGDLPNSEDKKLVLHLCISEITKLLNALEDIF